MNAEPQTLCQAVADIDINCPQSASIRQLSQILNTHEHRLLSLETRRTGSRQGKVVTISMLLHTRTRFGLTQAELGQLLGVHAMTVSRWERTLPPSRKYILDRIALLREMNQKQVKELLTHKAPIPLPGDGEEY